MLQEEIIVAPLLISGIHVLAERLAGRSRAAMPGDRVFLEGIVGGQIETAPEPPDRGLPCLFGEEEAHVGVGRWHIGIAGMNDQRDAHGLEAPAGQFRAAGGGRGRQGCAGDVRKIDPTLLDDRAPRQHPGSAAADPALVAPVVLHEAGGGFLRFQTLENPVLKIEKIRLDGVDVGRAHEHSCKRWADRRGRATCTAAAGRVPARKRRDSSTGAAGSPWTGVHPARCADKGACA